MTMELHGRVVWASSKLRVRNALVSFVNVATKEAKKPADVTDKDGNFSIASLEEGKWLGRVFHEDGRQVAIKEVTVTADDSTVLNGISEDKPMIFPIHHYENTLDQRAGKTLFWPLISAVFLLVAFWTWAHVEYPNPRPPSIASNLLNLTAQARYNLSDVKQLENGKGLKETLVAIKVLLTPKSPTGRVAEQLKGLVGDVEKMERILLPSSQRVLAEIADMDADIAKLNEKKLEPLSKASKEAKKALKKGVSRHEVKALETLVEELKNLTGHSLNTQYFGVLDALAKQPVQNAKTAEKVQFLTALTQVDKMLVPLAQAEFATSPNSSNSFLWSTYPWLLAEIYLWALFATLLRLIFIIHQYLRNNRFYRQGLFQHFAMIATIPFFTVAFVFVVSMVKLTGENSAVVVDMSDPRLVAGTAFLIALVPWVLWDRLQEKGRHTLGKSGDD